ncbi:MAG: FumA C-terminus/TtdB family hydratase beta subunit [Kiritimatiellia bacterium]|jgi:fumarate hydratase class I|nr:FumA C-terminus/TtdB family hydratase beta subunit [Kiritimatiellia bacterium]MDP6630738.1 FumA C-terminus/TtdB family hydratase beta subunit [Kiritimatiellia bacterium]MDP6809399.1 FumA C-terminus/TtdB family hydratase beta subunit [Kiritimatiellia bacterium]MDP7023924.1 FumA C-terminus/TtdB family hydratase beta subunit [Kiritimatiellia bacterium]
MIKAIEYPFTEEKTRGLRVGDTVSLSGRVCTGRDRLHQFLAEGGTCPVSLRDGAMYHCGPVVMQEGGKWVVRAAGPTTSIREEPYMADLIKSLGLRVIVGKGGMGEATRLACRDHGCVYLQTVGGAAALLAACIERVDGVHFLAEFGSTEAMWELHLRDLIAVVTMDARGHSLHRTVQRKTRKALNELLGE